MVETQKYKILRRIGSVEIRQYPKLILATTKIKAEEASNEAFGIIAEYIFGRNDANEKIEMTAPVMSTSNSGIFAMSFVMPSSLDIKSLPKPISDRIEIKEKKASKFAVLRFSGLISKEKARMKEQELRTILKENRLEAKGGAILMRYNPPWTIPFMRRNEIALELS